MNLYMRGAGADNSNLIPRQGQIIRWDQFQLTNAAFTTLINCCKFQKKTALNSYFLFFLNFFIDFFIFL